jgi:hypothetical protein
MDCVTNRDRVDLDQPLRPNEALDHQSATQRTGAISVCAAFDSQEKSRAIVLGARDRIRDARRQARHCCYIAATTLR